MPLEEAPKLCMKMASSNYDQTVEKVYNFQTIDAGLNSVHREIVSYVTIVFYDKVRGRNKAQRWLLLVCCGFFI